MGKKNKMGQVAEAVKEVERAAKEVEKVASHVEKGASYVIKEVDDATAKHKHTLHLENDSPYECKIIRFDGEFNISPYHSRSQWHYEGFPMTVKILKDGSWKEKKLMPPRDFGYRKISDIYGL